MRRLLILVAVLWATNPFPAAAEEPAPEHAAKIACDEPTFNFGDVDNSQDVVHTFVIRNDGDLTLEIGQVRPTCGCTVASVSRNQVPPGETAEITAKLSLRGRQGPQHKPIAVQSNDPQTPTLTLALEGKAVAELRVSPTQLFFGRLTTDAVATGIVEIAIDTTNVVHLTRADSDCPHVTVTRQASPDGRLYTLSVVTKPPLPRGTLRGSVSVETDHPRYPSMNVPLSAFVVGTFAFAPEEVTLTEDAATPVERHVLVRSELGKPFQIAAVEPPVPTIQVNISSTEPTAYRIDLANIVATQDLDGKVLRVRLSDEGEKELLIPFRVQPAKPDAPTP